jgi:hypothetical protein
MEKKFRDRDYNFAVEEITVDEVIPLEAKEFTARMRKFFAQIHELQSSYQRLTDNLKSTKGLQPVDDERQKIIDELVGVTTEDSKSKRFMSKVRRIIHDFELPELTDEEKRNL